MTPALPASLHQITEASLLPFECMHNAACLVRKATLWPYLWHMQAEFAIWYGHFWRCSLGDRQMGNTHINSSKGV